jgi:hypothetical protein
VQADRVGDGLYDDEEKAVYGTTPDVLISMVTARATARRSTSGPTPLTAGGPVARTDSDGNGLFNDEPAIYGTNPQVFAIDVMGSATGKRSTWAPIRLPVATSRRVTSTSEQEARG